MPENTWIHGPCRVGLNNGGGTFKITSKSSVYNGASSRTHVLATFTNTTISNSTASRGGVLSVYLHEAHGQVNVSMTDAHIRAGGASVDGGSMAVEFSRVHTTQVASTALTMTGNSSISGGRAEESGGVLAVLRSPLYLSMEDSASIVNTTCKEAGGAVYVRQHAGPVELLMQGNATIANCSAAEGGALSTSQRLTSTFSGDLFAGGGKP